MRPTGTYMMRAADPAAKPRPCWGPTSPLRHLRDDHGSSASHAIYGMVSETGRVQGAMGPAQTRGDEAPPYEGGVTHMRRQREGGFSMVEVLVSLLVLSLGLLGLAALQSNSMKSTHSAHLRTQATLYAYDMLDRLRANREAARAGAYDLAPEDAAPTCNPLAYDLVDCDRAEWRADVASLPDGTGAIGYDAGTQFATVFVQWNDERAGGSTTASVTIQSQL